MWVDPECTAASPVALLAAMRRPTFLIVLGPGSGSTPSVLAAAVVGDLRRASPRRRPGLAYVGNLRAGRHQRRADTTLADHLEALSRHGGGALPAVAHTDVALGACAVPVVSACRGPAADGWAHDPGLPPRRCAAGPRRLNPRQPADLELDGPSICSDGPASGVDPGPGTPTRQHQGAPG